MHGALLVLDLHLGLVLLVKKSASYWSEPRENTTEKDTEQPQQTNLNCLVPILATRRASKDGCRFLGLAMLFMYTAHQVFRIR